jgi:uncharacterized protein
MSMVQTSNAARNFNWLLNRFAQETPGVRHAAAVSIDGLLLAASVSLTRDDAEHLGALTAGMTSLTKGASETFQLQGVEQIVVEMNGGFLFVTAISRTSLLSVIAEKSADMGLMAYEMTLIAQECERVLTPELIIELKNPMQM